MAGNGPYEEVEVIGEDRVREAADTVGRRGIGPLLAAVGESEVIRDRKTGASRASTYSELNESRMMPTLSMSTRSTTCQT